MSKYLQLIISDYLQNIAKVKNFKNQYVLRQKISSPFCGRVFVISIPLIAKYHFVRNIFIKIKKILKHL